MREGDEIQVGPVSSYETWRVQYRRPDTARDDAIEPDGFAIVTRPLTLCGFPALNVPMSDVRYARRTLQDAGRDGMDDYKILFQISGQSTLHQDGRASELATGDFGLVDVTRPIRVVPGGGDNRLFCLHLPRAPLVSHLGMQPQGGLAWQGDVLPGRLLKRLLTDCASEADAPLGVAEPYMQVAVYNLVGALFATSPPHFSHSDKLFGRLYGIVKHHFANPDVGPVEVAAEAGISLRYLQKVFAARGMTYSQFIRSFRLEHAARLLQNRASLKTTLPLGEIARACGYRDYTHFARNFRARYGCTPSAFREDEPSSS